MIPLRMCLTCEAYFPLGEAFFYKSPRGRDGFFPYCKTCANVRSKHNGQKPEQKIKSKERSKKHYHEHKEEYAQARQRWYNANREYALEKARQDRINHPEVFAQRWQNWYRTENGKEHSRLRVRSRKARKKGAQGNYTHADIAMMYKRQKGKCYYCKAKLDTYHIEHIIPIVRGGTNDPSNIVLSCPPCNLSKGSKLPHEWAQGGRLL